jgi:hypothetical protein
MALPLFHFSEDPNIICFEPRRAPTSALDDKLVWAIDEWHAPMYYLPRDCPRACFWPGPETTNADRERFFGGVNARMVIAVESRWLERIRSTVLYRYTMPETTFERGDETAGHWTSRVAVEPLSVEPVGDLLTAIIGAGVELRITPHLIHLWRRVIASTMEFSGTRLRNAEGWSDLQKELAEATT